MDLTRRHLDYRDEALPPGVALLVVKPRVSAPGAIIIRSTLATPASLAEAEALLDITD